VWPHGLSQKTAFFTIQEVSFQNSSEDGSPEFGNLQASLRILCGQNKMQNYKKIHLMPPFSCNEISLDKIYITNYEQCVTHVYRNTRSH
jgi:hypothetical protein